MGIRGGCFILIQRPQHRQLLGRAGSGGEVNGEPRRGDILIVDGADETWLGCMPCWALTRLPLVCIWRRPRDEVFDWDSSSGDHTWAMLRETPFDSRRGSSSGARGKGVNDGGLDDGLAANPSLGQGRPGRHG